MAACLFAATVGAHAQTDVVTGTVRSAGDGGPLTGVNVVVKGTTVLAITDLDGRYSINVPSGSTTLTFSYVGFNTQDVLISGRSVVDIRLAVDVRQLDELVVTAFGVEQER
jgi:hypothetical protein